MSLSDWLSNPFQALKVRLAARKQRLRYKQGEDYDAAAYWHDRHQEFGFDLRGVGNKGLSPEENEAQYAAARTTFLDTLRDHHITVEGKTVLDVGCGVGFYTSILRQQGVQQYTGLDITNALFDQLTSTFPNYHFQQTDITETGLKGQYDLIVMIDVTQHITSPKKFATAMANLKAALKPGGHIILTSWLSAEESHSFYERSRTLEDYQQQFAGWTIGTPRPFRDKFIFVVSR